MILTLRRLPEYLSATPGHIFYYDRLICGSIELPWDDNRPFVSSIPTGEYEIDFTWSPRFGKMTIEILNVPGRSGIRVHSANVVDQLKGCIAPCENILIEEYRLFGQSSMLAVMALEKLVKDKRIGSIIVL